MSTQRPLIRAFGPVLEQLFRNTVGNEQEIRREEFQKIVTSKNPFFTERVFQIFDKDNSGSISLQEFIDAFINSQDNRLMIKYVFYLRFMILM
ncbi:hypothetical protein DOY81_010123, partial [Sarcophaga bullata]